MSFEHVGSITFCRIYSGKIEQGMALANTTRDKKERAGRMYLMHAADREEIKEAFAGDIVALQGLKDTRTGETLCDPAKPVILEKMDFPEPVINLKIEPKTKADQEKMAIALNTLALEDPSFRVSVDQESGETILKGMGELHLDIKVDILKRTYGVEANVGRRRSPIARRWRVPPTSTTRTRSRPAARASSRASSSSSSRTRPARATSSRPRSSAARSRSEYIPGVEKGVKSVWDNGVLIGFPLVDMKVTLYDGAFHEVDSSAIAFEIASRSAMKEGCEKGGVKILEPIMDVEVVTPRRFRRLASSATSTRGAARSARRRCAATPRSSAPTCRSQTCSAT